MIPEAYSDLAKLVWFQLQVFPQHTDYLARRFRDVDVAGFGFTNDLAGMVLRILGGAVEPACEDYRWMTQMLLEEELNFRRTGAYRLSTFAQANKEVYSDTAFMSRYINGLLLSQLWWSNHSAAMQFFRDAFIGGADAPFRHLEIGPGHGLFLHIASASRYCTHAEGWDVSATSVEGTRQALEAMGSAKTAELKVMNIFAAPDTSFDSITASEVIEHLEDPAAALGVISRLLRPGGRAFINAPVNSPAPDHLYLFRTPEEVVDLIRRSGLEVVETCFAPCTGASLDRARRLSLSVSAAIIARKP